ncbi:response regulator [Halobacteriovorax sp. HLS]|uniref:response regulator n=1 Tax=Halobacteriovorax sp. HLS TaxID=2234000 RepID=UPI000FDB3FCE|nr:response regulator [Halobacteriovorax sp. HLS]
MSKILIVDDERVICDMMADLYRAKGHDVTVAYSGNEGYRLVEQNVYDLVISDVLMDDGDGLEMAANIKRFNDSLSIILVTGYFDDTTSTVPTNVKKVFRKPIKFKEVLSYTEKLLGTVA